VSPTDPELAALPEAIAARPLTMSVWSLAVGRGILAKAAQDHRAVTQQAQEISTRARRAFHSD
jgi:hypothetical protein